MRPEGFFSSSMSGWRCHLCPGEGEVMRQSGLPEGHSNAAVKQHGLQRRLTSRIGGGMDGKKRAKGCAKQRVEDFATRIPESWQQIRPAQALWGPKRRAFPIGRSVKRPDANFLSAERRKGRKEQKHPTPERTAIFFLSSCFSFSFTNQIHNQPPPICLSTRCASPTASKGPRRELPVAHSLHSLHSTRPCPLTAQPLFMEYRTER